MWDWELLKNGEGKHRYEILSTFSDESFQYTHAVSYGTAPILQFSPGCRRVYRFGLRCRTEGQAAFDGMSLRCSLYER